MFAKKEINNNTTIILSNNENTFLFSSFNNKINKSWNFEEETKHAFSIANNFIDKNQKFTENQRTHLNYLNTDVAYHGYLWYTYNM